MAPTIWECTRFCLDENVWQKNKEEILFASTVLLVALGDLALRAGIESIIGNFDAAALHLWRRIGCEVEILGSTSRYGRPGLSRPAPHFRDDHRPDKEKAERRPVGLRRGAGHGGLRRAVRSARTVRPGRTCCGRGAVSFGRPRSSAIQRRQCGVAQPGHVPFAGASRIDDPLGHDLAHAGRLPGAANFSAGGVERLTHDTGVGVVKHDPRMNGRIDPTAPLPSAPYDGNCNEIEHP